MRLGIARAAARDWINDHRESLPTIHGAFFTGSTVGLPDDAELAASSDLDVAIVVSGPLPPIKLGKVRHHGVLLEISFMEAEQLEDPEWVLGTYYLAGSLRADSILFDPSGQLRAVHERVAAEFAQRHWVLRRCREARERVESHLARFDPLATWPDQVIAWLFATGVTSHVILVAALRNPTIRLRYLAARRVLQEYGRPEFYEQLLGLLGCADLQLQQARRHQRHLATTFDTACAVARKAFPFSSDITPAARPIVIDGGTELIRSGDYRESIFWTAVTFGRCHKILAVDAPRRTQYELTPAFDELLADLGIGSTDDLINRCRSLSDALPAVWDTATAIVDENPEVLAART